MRKYLYFFIVLSILDVSAVLAQSFGQFYITSYERKEPFYFCEGTAMLGGQNIWYGIANLNYKNYNRLDSLRFIGDTTVFQVSKWKQRDSVDIGEATMSNVYYVPKKVGIDTIKIIGYYGAFYSIGTIICHAKPSPPIGFYGVSIVLNDVGGGFQLGGSDEVLTKDTLHDEFFRSPYAINGTSQSQGLNKSMYVYACGSVTIDSIYTVGDFSEIDIQNIPSLPHSMSSGDSIVMPYTFTPKVPGETDHYLVLHTTSGQYLVWSFEYEVLPQNGVSQVQREAGSIHIYPNPSSEKIHVKMEGIEFTSALLEIYDQSGIAVVRQPINSDITLDVSKVASGAYTLVIKAGERTETKRFVVRH